MLNETDTLETMQTELPPVDPVDEKISELAGEYGADNLIVKVSRIDNNGVFYCGECPIDSFSERWIKEEFGGGKYRCKAFCSGMRGQRGQWDVPISGLPKIESARTSPLTTAAPISDIPPNDIGGGTGILALIMQQSQIASERDAKRTELMMTMMMQLFETMSKSKRESTPIQDLKALMEIKDSIDGTNEFGPGMIADVVSILKGATQNRQQAAPIRQNVRVKEPVTQLPATEEPAKLESATETTSIDSDAANVIDLYAAILSRTQGEDREPKVYGEIAFDIMGDDNIMQMVEYFDSSGVTLADSIIALHPNVAPSREFLDEVENYLRKSFSEVQVDEPSADDGAQVSSEAAIGTSHVSDSASSDKLPEPNNEGDQPNRIAA